MRQTQGKKGEDRMPLTNEEFEKEKNATEQHFSDGYIENICLYRNICKQLPNLDRFLLHSAILQYENEAFAGVAVGACYVLCLGGL